ncbi:unnamed protein product, partial [Ectocarpus sp. 13 AM-2016]
VGVVWSRRRRQDRDVDQFIESFQHMYDEGKRQGGSAAGGAGGLVGGVTVEGNSEIARRYDPKAMVFVDPKLRRKYGHEGEKGRHKRHLFMEVHDMAKVKGRPLLTLQQLMAMPSSYDPLATNAMSDTTIILNQWTRTTLADQLDAVLRLTVHPAGGVWVCAFNSPREAEYRAVVESYRSKFGGDRGGGLFFVASSFNFKYYGRFQMALQARTKYVWVIDDDVMPGRHFLHQLNHIAGIYEAEGADGTIGPMGLGSVGWIMPGVKTTEKYYSYRYHTDKGGLFLPDKRYGIPVPHLQEVDLLCSHWFVETDWVKLLFREKWETPQTGEDYMLAYSLRKHAGVRSFVLPMDLGDSETWGNVDVDWNMQHQGGEATTLRSTVPMRDRIWHRLFKRGGEYFMSLRYASRPRPLLLVVDGAFDAQALRALFLVLQDSYPPTSGGAAAATAVAGGGGGGGVGRGASSNNLEDEEASSSSGVGVPQRPPRVVLTGRGGGSASCSLAARDLGNSKDGRVSRGGAALCDPDTFASAWNLVAGRHFPRQGTSRSGGSGGRDHVLMVDLALGLAGAVSTVKPLAIVSVAGTGPSAGTPGGVGGGGAAIDEAVAVVAGQAGVPVVRLPRRASASAAALWLSRLTPKAFRAWHRPRVDIVVVYEPSPTNGGNGGGGGGHTEAQLEALLNSISEAHYLGDSVGITIAVASGPVPDSVGDESFPWPRGRKTVRGGPLFPSKPAELVGGSASPAALALRSWMPRGDNEEDSFVVVLEADRVVSPLFYSWLKVAVLETSYGGAAAPKPSDSDRRPAAAAGSRGGVCVPGDALGEAGGGTWLMPAGHWRAAQVRCLGNKDGFEGGGGGGRPGTGCESTSYPQPSERVLCPIVTEPGEALVGRTGADGALLDGWPRGLMENGDALASFVERVLLP